MGAWAGALVAVATIASAHALLTHKETSMRRLDLLGSGKFLVLLFLCSLLSSRAHAEAFDGTWSVLEVCESSPEGARGYKWTYPATVKDGYFVGQYRQEGQSPSMSLKGMIKPDGSARLIAHGISADSDHNIKFAPAQTPINFEVRANFTGKTGAGERVSGRVCKFSFTRSAR